MSEFLTQLSQIADQPAEKLGIVIVDHGSRRQESNALLEEVVNLFRQVTNATNVQTAHMEIAEPSIATAFTSAVAEGAELVVVFPYFLSPGRHWNADIPKLAADAAADHPGVRHLVTAPLGLHEAMIAVMQYRIKHCLAHAAAGGEDCQLCSGSDSCQLHGDQ